ncbi:MULTISPECIES: N-acetylmuramoyl-L-alanine amidase [unclassified Mycobacterium]|uniref:N-acetylmuramoyl-L-alanine amidase n=1 Tax=unclassified Mycobacterium TaxID=2642494 RepID=UPI000AE69C0B|nr:MULTISPECIES: N-acetylmuramoyl-L-alanine amidase [unclassified Mycobacterium]
MPTPDRPGEPPGLLDRRQLLTLAGGLGVASILGACSTSTTGVRLTAATSAQLLCRDAWGARAARPGGKPHTITRMTLHHEAVVLGDNRNAPSRLREDQRYHQDQKGWIDIAYHVGVDRNGNIYELRSTEIAGDTATDYNTTGHFLVLCEGDFDQEAVSEAQLHGAALAFAWAVQNFRIATDTLAGHRDLAQTSCPGANLYAHLTSGDLKRRINDLVSAGPVDLQRFCGPDAAARVAAIEAGG